ncbi:MAG: UDP-glucose/GDP-mannose dehydrogenase family protein [Gammaproteobacteria bacterium]
MNISIVGTGYVGLVTGACLAEVGHRVLCMDVDKSKIEELQEGGLLPIYEPGLEQIIDSNRKNGQLTFTPDTVEAIEFADLIFIAVGTPPDEDGSADLSHVLDVATNIGKYMENPKLVVTKSTVPVGTSDKVRATVTAALKDRDSGLQVTVASNPEFLKEGAAVADFMKPDRIIVGTDSDSARQTLKELYAPFNRNSDRMVYMDIRSAELTKYAANAMLATKISFINEVANLAEQVGADIEQVRLGIGSDPRIGYQFIYPGCGYGGSCFPKDVRALGKTALEHGLDLGILAAVEQANIRQKEKLFSFINQYFKGDISGKTFALWGLAFKPRTDDMREAPSRSLMEALWDAGAMVRAYDPEAMEEARRLYPQQDRLILAETRDDALHGADALVICTEWQHFRAPDFELIKQALSHPAIFDGRNLYDPQKIAELGFTYYAIGRGASVSGP